MANAFVKDPDDLLDYFIDWATWLAGDTITTSTWTVDPGLTKTSDSHTSSTVTVWLSGGVDGVNYNATNRIVTAGGRIKDRTYTFLVRQA